jgi:hypothetical protein
MKPAFSDDRDRAEERLESDDLSPSIYRLAFSILGSPFGLLGFLFGGYFAALSGQARAGFEDRQIAKEYGAQAACPNCRRLNSVRTPVCPRCETRLID